MIMNLVFYTINGGFCTRYACQSDVLHRYESKSDVSLGSLSAIIAVSKHTLPRTKVESWLNQPCEDGDRTTYIC